MQHVLVFSTSAPQNTLTDEMIGDLLDRVGLPAASSPPDWLAPGQAARDPLADGEAPRITALRRAGEAVRIDINVVALENRRKKLLLADMDSTIITDESLDEMAALAGLGEAVAAITARSMNGELDFEAALDERVAMFAGQPASLFESILAATQLTAGARTLVQTMRTHHAHCYLVSGGFTPVADRVAEWCGFHAAHANDMTISDGVITGTVKNQFWDGNPRHSSSPITARSMRLPPAMPLPLVMGQMTWRYCRPLGWAWPLPARMCCGQPSICN